MMELEGSVTIEAPIISSGMGGGGGTTVGEGNNSNSGAIIVATSAVTRDDVQDKLAIFARLEKEFCDLIEAYEILLVERIHLEEIITVNSQLESLDDLELVGQYYKAIQDTSQISKLEIARLTEQLESFQTRSPPPIAAAPSSVEVNKGGGGAAAIEFAPVEKAKVVYKEEEEKEKVVSPTSSTNSSRQLQDIEGQIGILRQQVKEKDVRIAELESTQQSLMKDKSSFTSRDLERSNLITALESQKMALETKVSYMQRQLQDYDGLRGRLQDLSQTSQLELQRAEGDLLKCRQRLELTETNLNSTRRDLEACQIELSILREESNKSLRSLSMENVKLESEIRTIEGLLEEERERCDRLAQQVSVANEQLLQTQTLLASREAEIVKQSRTISVDYGQSPSVKSIEEVDGIRSSRHNSTTNLLENSVRALKSECQKLALENSRLRVTSQSEYIRNIVLRFLQLPDQRRTLLPVLANLFRFTEVELASIKK